jgi:hypothetical protein
MNAFHCGSITLQHKCIRQDQTPNSVRPARLIDRSLGVYALEKYDALPGPKGKEVRRRATRGTTALARTQTRVRHLPSCLRATLVQPCDQNIFR